MLATSSHAMLVEIAAGLGWIRNDPVELDLFGRGQILNSVGRGRVSVNRASTVSASAAQSISLG